MRIDNDCVTAPREPIIHEEINEENYKFRSALGIEKDNGEQVTNSSDGVWLGDAEMPDAEHLKDE